MNAPLIKEPYPTFHLILQISLRKINADIYYKDNSLYSMSI